MMRERLTSGALTSKNGFSVVAPIEHDDPVLDRVQQRVLLRLAEPVDLVDEQDRALPEKAEAVGRRRDGRAQLGDAAGDRADLLEVRLRRRRR